MTSRHTRDGRTAIATPLVPAATWIDGDAGEPPPGLRRNAISFVSNVVIGLASTAPGYSLAATLGLTVAVTGIGLQTPAIILVAFVPMLFIAAAYYWLNRGDPDCGTTYAW